MAGFVTMVDAVGGVDVDVARPLSDPNYGGSGSRPGWSIAVRPHHLDGANALAYARVRKSKGESDFTRAARQQEVLVALRDEAVESNLLFSLPGLLDAVGDSVRTDLPTELLPELAALAEQIGGDRTTRAVLTSPMVKSGGRNHPYGSVVIPVPSRIAEMVAAIFPPPARRRPRGRRSGRRRRRRHLGRAQPVQPAAGRRPRLEPREQPAEVVVDEQQRPMTIRDEALGCGVIDVRDQRVEEAADVERADRLHLQPKLRPRQDLGQLLERAEAARQGEEACASSAMTAFRSWSVVTTLRSVTPRWASSRSTRPDGMTPATAAGKRGIGDGAHQSEPAAAVHELDAAPRQLRPDRRSRVRVAGRAPSSPRRRHRCCAAPASEPVPVQDRRHAAPRPSRGRSRSFPRPTIRRASGRRAAPTAARRSGRSRIRRSHGARSRSGPGRSHGRGRPAGPPRGRAAGECQRKDADVARTTPFRWETVEAASSFALLSASLASGPA